MAVSARGAPNKPSSRKPRNTWGQVRTASQVTLDGSHRALRSLETMPGRRLFLLVPPGFNSGTLELERDRLINRALRAGIVISSVDAKVMHLRSPAVDPTNEISVVSGLPFQTFRFETSSIGNRGLRE